MVEGVQQGPVLVGTFFTCCSPSRGLIMVMLRSLTLKESLASSSDLAPIMSSKLLRLM